MALEMSTTAARRAAQRERFFCEMQSRPDRVLDLRRAIRAADKHVFGGESGFGRAALVVYQHLVHDRMNKQEDNPSDFGVAWPRIDTMCASLGLPRTTVTDALRRLVEGGVLVRDPGKPGSSTRYSLSWSQFVTGAREGSHSPVRRTPVVRSAGPLESGAPDTNFSKETSNETSLHSAPSDDVDRGEGHDQREKFLSMKEQGTLQAVSRLIRPLLDRYDRDTAVSDALVVALQAVEAGVTRQDLEALANRWRSRPGGPVDRKDRAAAESELMALIDRSVRDQNEGDDRAAVAESEIDEMLVALPEESRAVIETVLTQPSARFGCRAPSWRARLLSSRPDRRRAIFDALIDAAQNGQVFEPILTGILTGILRKRGGASDGGVEAVRMAA